MLDTMTLDQLRALEAVAETGSFSAAARRLGRVQSAVSQAIQALETSLGLALFDRSGKVPQLNDAGRVVLADARNLLRSAEALKARAESIAEDLEPELTLAVESMLPMNVLTDSLRALQARFPLLPVTVYTEALGGAEQRLRDGTARIAFYPPNPIMTENRETEFVVTIPTVPVVAADHPLASEPPPLSRAVLERQVQLVLTDRSPLSSGISAGIISHRTWRFADLSTRLEFLLGGFGWCNMPLPMVAEAIRAGRLKVLDIAQHDAPEFRVHAVYPRGRTPGKAGRWLIDEIRQRAVACTNPLAEAKVMVSNALAGRDSGATGPVRQSG
jgi:DNA-binding transcriptional LysR family regulator